MGVSPGQKKCVRNNEVAVRRGSTVVPPSQSSIQNLCNISNTRDRVSSGYPNTEKRVEHTTRSGVFLTKFEVFG